MGMVRGIKEEHAIRLTQAKGKTLTPSIYLVAKTKVDLLRDAKLYAGITAQGKTWDCSRLSAGGIAAKLERLKRENASTIRTITGATQTNPVVVTSAAHGFKDGDDIDHASVLGMIELTGAFKITNITANTYALAGIDGTAWGAYTSGGTSTILCEWIDSGNSVNALSVANFILLCDAINNYVDLVVRTAREHKNAIAALATLADVNAYDYTVNWPSTTY